MNEVDISGLDKAELLVALFDESHQQGSGVYNDDSEGLPLDEAREMLENYDYFDYVKGRILKVDLSGDELNTSLYNRDNGAWAAEKVVDAVTKRGE